MKVTLAVPILCAEHFRKTFHGSQAVGAIARALVASPAIVLADEPTGALDSAHSQRVVELLTHLVSNCAQTVILVTHDPAIAGDACGGGARRARGDGRGSAAFGQPRP